MGKSYYLNKNQIFYFRGSIIQIHNDRDKEQMFSYIIILELGTENFREKMLSTARNYVKKDEELLMNILMDPAEVLKQIHQGEYIGESCIACMRVIISCSIICMHKTCC